METIELRDKPALKLIINESGFRLFDSADPSNNGDYSFKKLNQVEFHQEQTDWFVSIISLVVDLFTGGGTGGKFKNQAKLKFKLDHRTFKVYLRNADLDKAKALTILLNSKCQHTTLSKVH